MTNHKNIPLDQIPEPDPIQPVNKKDRDEQLRQIIESQEWGSLETNRYSDYDAHYLVDPHDQIDGLTESPDEI